MNKSLGLKVSLSKLQLAIALGATGAICFTYWYYKSRKPSKVFKEPEKKLTPLQEAINFKNKGNELFKDGDFDKAIIYYNQAIEACPKDKKIDLATFYQNRAAAYEKLEKWGAVLEDCSEAIGLNPKYVKALTRRAKIYESTNKIMQALEDVTAVCILEAFKNQSSIITADRVLRKSGLNEVQQIMKNRKIVYPSKFYIKTYLETFQDDPVLLLAKDKQFLEKDCTNKSGFAKAIACLNAANYENIVANCSEEIESSESESIYKNEARLLRGTFYLISGQADNAKEDFDTLINDEYCDKKIRANAATKLASMNLSLDPQKLDEYYEKALELDPDNFDVHYQKAHCAMLSNNMDDAIKHFKKAISLKPDYNLPKAQLLFARYRKAVNQMNIDELTKIIDDLRELIQKNPNCDETLSLYAQILAEQQKFEEADAQYEKIVKINPKNASIYVQRAVLKLQWDADFDKSIEILKEAIRIDDKCVQAYEVYGTLEVQRGNLDRAIEMFDKAIESGKNEAELSHLCSLKNAAIAQKSVTKKLGLSNDF